jgi:hypothetical protein
MERGLSSEALVALDGLHLAPSDEPPYDADDCSEVDDQEKLRDQLISRAIQIEEAISRNRDLPDDVKEKWIAILQECCCAT